MKRYAELADEVPVLGLREHRLQRLPVGEPLGVGPSGGLGELLFHRQARKARLDPPDGVDI